MGLIIRGTKLFQAAINATTLRAILLFNALPPVRHTYLKNKALHFVCNVEHVERLLLLRTVECKIKLA